MEHIPENYNELKCLYLDQKRELEGAKQSIYECKRELKTYKTLEVDYKEEIRLLQLNENVELNKLKELNQQLSAEKNALKQQMLSNTTSLESALIDKDTIIADLQEKFAKQKLVPQLNTEDDDLLNDLQNACDKNLELEQYLNQMKTANEEIKNENKKLQQQCAVLDEELTNFKEIFECKKSQLDEANTIITTLKDENWCLKQKLDSMECKPLDMDSRGNSMFAEVDDRRRQLEGDITLMKKRYLRMKEEQSGYVEQINALQQENSLMVKKYKDEINERFHEKDRLDYADREETRSLKNIIASYKKDIQEKVTIIKENPEKLRVFQRLEIKNKEIADLREKYELSAFSHRQATYKIIELERENRELNVQIMELQNKLTAKELEMKHLEKIIRDLEEDLRNKENNAVEAVASQEKEVNEIKSCLKIKTDLNVQQSGGLRKVTFD